MFQTLLEKWLKYFFPTSPKRTSGCISNINITGYRTHLFENLNREKLALLVANRLPANSAIDTDTHPLVFYRKQKKLQHWVKFCYLGSPTLHNQIIWPNQGEEGLVPLFSPLLEQQQKLKTKKAAACDDIPICDIGGICRVCLCVPHRCPSM